MYKAIHYFMRNLFPRRLKSKIDIFRQDMFLKDIRLKILDYYKDYSSTGDDDQILKVLSYLKENPLHMFPYEFIYKYDSNNVEVHRDEISDYKYVIYQNKRLYYPLEWSEENIKYAHTFSCLEQDNESPHSYESSSFLYNEKDIVVDAGAAEGNFSLSIVENVKRIYIFECAEGWIAPLKKTFEPWQEKVEIVPLKLSNKNANGCITLNKFFTEKNELPTKLKIDVDGGEKDLLSGASRILKQSDELKILLCTYHQKNDFLKFKLFFEKLGFKVYSSKGYMIFYIDEPLIEPYLRRGLLFASRSK